MKIERSGAMAIDAEELLAHGAWLARIARVLVARADEVDDVVQQTYARAFEQPPRHATNVRAWLGAVARNVVRMKARSDRARERRELATPLSSPVEDPAEAVERAELRRLVLDAVLALEEPYRSTVILRFVDELEVAAIARTTGTNENTVRTRLRRGMETLKQRLEQRVRGDAASETEGAAAVALLFTRLRMAASRETGVPAVPSSGLRGGRWTRRSAVATTRKVGVGALVAAALVVAAWWIATRPKSLRAVPAEVANSPAGVRATEPSPSPAVAVDRVPQPEPRPEVAPPLVNAPPAFARGTLHGVVTDPKGRPLAGAVVWAIEEPAHETTFEMPTFAEYARSEAVNGPSQKTVGPWRPTTSGADGSYSFTELSTAPGWVVGAFDAEVGAAVSPMVDFDHDHRERSVDLRLVRGVQIRGVVRDMAGTPIGTAPMHLLATFSGEKKERAQISDSMGRTIGRFELGFECGDTMELAVSAPGFEERRLAIDLDAPGGQREIAVTLARRAGVVVRGRLVDADGKPLGLVALLESRFPRDKPSDRAWKPSVWAVPEGDDRPAARIEGRTDFDGDGYEFVLPAGFRGTLVLRIDHTTAGTAPIVDLAHPPDLPCHSEKLPVPPAGTVYALRFVDAETKMPIDLSHERLLPQIADETSLAEVLHGSSQLEVGVVRYRWSPGRAKVESFTSGHALGVQLVDFPDEAPSAPIEVELPHIHGGVRGVVRRADGSVFPRAHVSLFQPQPTRRAGSIYLPTTTNRDGEFECPFLANGEYVVVAAGDSSEASAEARFTVADSFPEVDLRCETGVRTRFHVRMRPEERVPKLRFHVWDAADVVVQSGVATPNPNAEPKDEFALTLSAGRYVLEIESPGVRDAHVDFSVPTADPIEVTLEKIEPARK